MTLLDPQETNVNSTRTPPVDHDRRHATNGETFRHSGWAHPRRLIRSALERTGATANRLQNWDQCGSNAWVLQSPTDPTRLRIAANFCHDRFCRPCSNTRSRLASTNLRNRLGSQPIRFLTLTLKHSGMALSCMIRLLYKSFRTLRGRRFWKDKVDGGCAFLEVKWNDSTGQWHPHLHCLIQGHYLPKTLVSEAWNVITNGSFIIDIRFVHSTGHAASYIAKYASKPLSNTFLNRPDQLDEAIIALRSTRMVHTFGSWRGFRLFQHPEIEEWIPIGPLDVILAQARDGITTASNIVACLLRDQQCNHKTVRGPPSTTGSHHGESPSDATPARDVPSAA